MFNDYDLATTKTWIALMMNASIAMVVSKYPWMLTNCSMPDAVWLPFFRGVICPLTLIVIVMVPLVYGPNQELRNAMLGNVVHVVWTVIMVASYLVSEFYALLKLKIAEPEKTARWFLFWSSLICAIIFSALDLLADVAAYFDWWCCFDVWRQPTAEEREAFIKHGFGQNWTDAEVTDMVGGRSVLFDTASGWARIFRVVGFVVECLMLLSLSLSMLVIYYFCEERHLKFPARPDGYMTLRKEP